MADSSTYVIRCGEPEFDDLIEFNFSSPQGNAYAVIGLAIRKLKEVSDQDTEKFRQYLLTSESYNQLLERVAKSLT